VRLRRGIKARGNCLAGHYKVRGRAARGGRRGQKKAAGVSRRGGDKVGLLTSLQHFIEVCQAILECFAINREIIREHLHDLLDQVREYRHHAPLK
jgi:hypothetical protein